MKISDIFEKYQNHDNYDRILIKVYDDEEDEAPFLGTSPWDFPHHILQEEVDIVDTWVDIYEDNEGEHITLIVEAIRREKK